MAYQISPTIGRAPSRSLDGPLDGDPGSAFHKSSLTTYLLAGEEPVATDTLSNSIPNMWSPPHMALYAHYACIGMVQGLVTNALLPYCLYVAGGQPNTCSTVSTFVNLPWGFKLFYGLLSDCVPIRGLRRKPYLILGWSLTFGGALAMALLESVTLPIAASIFLGMTVACAPSGIRVGFGRDSGGIRVGFGRALPPLSMHPWRSQTFTGHHFRSA